MLTDVKIKMPHPVVLLIMGGVFGVHRIGRGFYNNVGFNFSECIDEKIEEYPDIEGIGSYGVFDSEDQSIYCLQPILEKDQRLFAVGMTLVEKSKQPQEGGWRWHKWGDYLGRKNPQHEYLFDEGDDIQEVCCYNIVQILR